MFTWQPAKDFILFRLDKLWDEEVPREFTHSLQDRSNLVRTRSAAAYSDLCKTVDFEQFEHPNLAFLPI